MFKRFWWIFPAMAAVGVMVWWSSGHQPKSDGAGVVSDREAPAARSSILPGGELDREVARESSRHSAGEIERHQAEERRFFELKRAVREQVDKVEESRQRLATLDSTKNDSDKGPEASDSVTREDAISRGLNAQEYVDAKRDFETNVELLEALKLKLVSERVRQ